MALLNACTYEEKEFEKFVSERLVSAWNLNRNVIIVIQDSRLLFTFEIIITISFIIVSLL